MVVLAGLSNADWIQLGGAIAAFLAAAAALGAAYVALRSARLAENAALLGSIPLPVPWVDNDHTQIKLVNRGNTDCHELEWWLIVEGNDKKPSSTDRVTDVIPAGRPHNLTDRQNAAISALRGSERFMIRCRYMTSWGEYLTLERTYIDFKSSGVTVRDEHGHRLTLRQPRN